MRKKREWRKACAWLLCGALLSTALPQAGWAQEGEPGSEDDVIYYESWDSEEERWKTESLKAGSYEILQEGNEDWNDDDGGWYVVPATDETIKTLDRINIEGDVHLILLNNSSFECQNGIQVSEGSSLSIYAQEITSEELPGQLNAPSMLVSVGASQSLMLARSTSMEGKLILSGTKIVPVLVEVIKEPPGRSIYMEV